MNAPKYSIEKIDTLKQIINNYLQMCLENKKPPTKIGLYNALSFTEADLSHYRKNIKMKEVVREIEKAFALIKQYWVEALIKDTSGIKFYLSTAFGMNEYDMIKNSNQKQIVIKLINKSGLELDFEGNNGND